eukprot:GHUV01009787.1.p3 GENE.GHUV01009787.1~~GHUV01009787.1.p3  ORF type:complete len:100 (-),score=6.66 GHUV01009787.1:269-568(-)
MVYTLTWGCISFLAMFSSHSWRHMSVIHDRGVCRASHISGQEAMLASGRASGCGGFEAGPGLANVRLLAAGQCHKDDMQSRKTLCSCACAVCVVLVPQS